MGSSLVWDLIYFFILFWMCLNVCLLKIVKFIIIYKINKLKI